MSRQSLLLGLIGILASVAGTAAADARAALPPVSFNRDVRPILSDSCFRCHGPDARARKAGLRLDTKAGATAVLKSGDAAVVPGDVENSTLLARVTAEDPFELMPPPKAGKRLNTTQIKGLERWIAQGAKWDEHWSLIPAFRPVVPEVKNKAWLRSAVDPFILTRLEARQITPSPEADRTTLVRRLYFDLIGLPPEPETVDAFLADARPDAYERVVDRLLASPEYGERMAVGWLDLVRFADTVGYHSDVERRIALYRDYVIKSFNEDLPFDRFTIEQLAGDLLPQPAVWQRIASAYNMLGLTTEEGGAQPKEYLARYAADRVRNAGSVWMGATLACAECHDHKYDPYTARDFYSFAAFFADLQQRGVGTPKPGVAFPTPDQASELAKLDARIAKLEAAAKASGPNKGKSKAKAAPAKDSPASIELREARAERARLDRSIRQTIVSVSGPPHITRVLHRGDWMDESGEIVEPTVPHFMKPLDVPAGRRATRLDLARWLIAADHPQTARSSSTGSGSFFGAGLSDSLEDLGSQGEWPTHPELLDWLAVEFREGGWLARPIIRRMVTSATYRQASLPRDDLAMIDPANRLYARQASFRLEAEEIRDSALAAAGLLVRQVGGESARPYQPAGYWRFLNFPQRDYIPSAGADQYRRGLYTHWQRTLLHPSLLAFDAPSREMCTAKRSVSNTPQAALVLMNDPSFVEAARALAVRTLRNAGSTDDQRLTWIWRQVFSRPPAPAEKAILQTLLAKNKLEFTADRAGARRLATVGQAPKATDLDPTETAAWTSVARAILNLDEAITRD